MGLSENGPKWERSFQWERRQVPARVLVAALGEVGGELAEALAAGVARAALGVLVAVIGAWPVPQCRGFSANACLCRYEEPQATVRMITMKGYP
jgi:hypothetical protein